MIDIQITRLIASAIIAVLLGWGCYVTAYIKHKNAIMDEENKILLEGSDPYLSDKVRSEKVKTWYIGYRLALVGLIIVATVVGWATAYFVSGEHELTWVEDCLVAGLGALIGGLILDKYIIHPIADGKFFEKVEDPLVDRFLQDGIIADPEMISGTIVAEKVEEKKSWKERRAEKKAKKTVEEAPAVTVEEKDPFDGLSFDEKIKLIERLKKTL